MQLLPLLFLFFFSYALGSPSDVIYMKKLVANEGQLIDVKDFAGFVNIFTRNASYDSEVTPPVYGIDAIQAALSKFFPAGTISQNAVNTESITLLSPFDEQGAANTATGVIYTTSTKIGQNELAGQALTVFGKYEDKYVKTKDLARYGGWRISERQFIQFVSSSKLICLETQGRAGG